MARTADTNIKNTVRFFPDDECDNVNVNQDDKASLYRFEQGLDIEMLIHAPAVLMNIIIEKFATDATVVETLTFKNMSGSSK